jgi:murein DD-endopeptidase MepM/ murein hydrolase activator NlpD
VKSLTVTMLAIFAALLFAAVGSRLLRAAGGQAVASENGIEGKWTGILGGRLHLVVEITKASNGELGGTLNSVDQHALLPLSNITLNGNAVRFEAPRVGGVYEGKLKSDGSGISGTWVQTGVPAKPLDFARSAESSARQDEAKAEHTPKPIAPLFNMTIPIAPTAFKADGKWHLVYELQLSNMDKWDYRFARIEVMPRDERQRATAVATFSGAELDGMFTHPGVPNAEKVSKLAPGEFGVVFMWETFDSPGDAPAAIAHRISVKIGDYPEAMAVDTLATSVIKNPVRVIAPPLRGEDWLAVNGPSNSSLHRRALIPINGHGYISQRFAIDWVQLNPDGKTYRGDPSDNKNYRAYGAEILAVADGVVTQIKDGIPQNTPGANTLAVPITLETIGGNHVIEDIGGGLYAFYAHMQPGSVRVRVGDKIKSGQVIGLLGNSGNSSEPHLHFQICDANSELGSEGIPYALRAFEVLGKGWGWKSSEAHEAAAKHEMEIPTENEVVRFPVER